jgi:hypothetical protein
MVDGTAKSKAKTKPFHEWVIQNQMLSRVFVFNSLANIRCSGIAGKLFA